MNEIVNNFLIVGDKFMSKILDLQSGFTYSAGRSCTKIKEYKNLKKHQIQDTFIETN